ncbi:MAG TPA: polyprenyl synthetase family protein, partial [Rhizobiaceae bacterium]|nr:polyprenyl synthetase family protein [Rhizobiaceae bacterium]
IAAGASADETATLRRFGEICGRAFQLADDILDVTQSTAALGKQTAKDAGRGKATLVSLIGIEESRAMTQMLLEQALAEIEPFGAEAAWLREAAAFIVSREH